MPGAHGAAEGLFQFLVEAIILSFASGFPGSGAGALLTAVNRAMPNARLDPAHIPVEAVMLSPAVAAGTGILLGIFPATRAPAWSPSGHCGMN